MSRIPACLERAESHRASLATRVRALGPQLLRQLRRGIEKESLRTDADGHLALTPHPAGLGSALTHPSITTDFSESQIELITGVHDSIAGCLAELTELHQVTLAQMGDERLWATSMPCRLPPEDQIPIGQYGTSNVGRTKTVYRTGLSHRYGRRMQTISGLHYNFSMPDAAWPLLCPGIASGTADERVFRDAAYFSLIRNFRRDSWLLMLLFGASPVVDRQFVEGNRHLLQPLGEQTMHLPHATSLRMGPLGYQSDAQSRLGVSYNCLNSYAESLRDALSQPYPAYEAIGIRDADGNYRQLSTSLLQIENEFYGTIRPKQPTERGERPLSALASRGVAYVEVRLMDLDPFSPIGIEADTIRFLDLFLLHCLLSDSPPDSPESLEFMARNRHMVAQRGREPDLRLLLDDGSQIPLRRWADGLLDGCEPIAAALDVAHPELDGAWRRVLAAARTRVADTTQTPSAAVLASITSGRYPSATAFARDRSLLHREMITALPLSPQRRAHFEALAAGSLAQQRAVEAADTMSFEAWRRHYVQLPSIEGLTPATAVSCC